MDEIKVRRIETPDGIYELDESGQQTENNQFQMITGGESIGYNKDFDTYLNVGNYTISTNANVNSASNIPARVAGRLTVSNPVGEDGETYLYRRQEYNPYSIVAAVSYHRYGFSNDGGETWTWKPWEAVRDVLSSGEPIDSSVGTPADMDDFIAPGAYLVRTTSIAATVLNLPVSAPGRLFVMDMLNSYVRGDSGIYIRQFYIPHTTANSIYTRYASSNDSGTTWTWNAWVALIPVPPCTSADDGKSLKCVNGVPAWSN